MRPLKNIISLRNLKLNNSVVSMVRSMEEGDSFLRLHLIRHIIILMYDTIMKSGGIF